MKPTAVVLAAALVSLAPMADSKAEETGGPRHVIYLHGRIVQEQQKARPKSDRFGYYEQEKILAAFRAEGFVVRGDIRPKATTESAGADAVVAQVKKLLDSGVPPSRITVVGASMGAGIAIVASARLQNPDVKFCVMGACLSENARRIREEEGKALAGRFLAIREESDEYTSDCPPFREEPGSKSISAREIVLHTGLNHGFLYRPLPEWVKPAIEFAKSP
ncbi:MAG TPA: hypothetical protein VKG01_17610 [Thermoanaerobaculia bacterium]|nr:hypothetical protein [Thermoanaerobaculia bacterium]